MAYVNGGAKAEDSEGNLSNVKTKKVLKELVKADPEKVLFFPTSEMGAQYEGAVSALQPGLRLSVCGPDPYKSRKWYATIEKTAKGLVVS